MASGQLDVLLVGYGAVGMIYAYILENSKVVRTTVVARGNYASLKERGAHIQSQKFGEHIGWKPYRTLPSVEAAADRPYAYVVVTAKAIPDVTPTPTLLAPLLTEEYTRAYGQPTFALLQNGLGVEEGLHGKAEETEREPVVLSAAVYIDTNLTDSRDGVRHTWSERLRIGVYTGIGRSSEMPPSAKAAASLQRFMAIVSAGGGDVAAPANIQHEKFRKNTWNAAVATCCCLARVPTPAFTTSDRVASLMLESIYGVLREIVAVGQALGYPVDDEFARAQALDAVQGEDSRTTPLKPSTLVDVERGVPIEVEVIVGSLVRWGKLYGVPMPRFELIYSLLSVYQAQAIRASS